MTAMERPPFLSQFFKRLITVFLRHRLSTFDSPLWARLLPIVGVGLPATQLISRQRSFMTGS